MKGLAEFIDEGYSFQQKYEIANGRKGPLDSLTKEERYNYILEFSRHMVEEIFEAQKHVPRRAWRKKEEGYLDSNELRNEFIEEMFDVLLFYRSVLTFAGISGEEFLKVAEEKLNYNSNREDHRDKNG